jgi:hypothetical protein
MMNLPTNDQTQQQEPKWGSGVLYGRKWQILIYKPAYKKNDKGEQERDPEHDIAMNVSDLKCSFKCSYVNGVALTVGTLVVYNMNAATEAEVINEAFQISISGGYEQGQYGEIYTGDIVQVIRNRENGIDYRLEIVALQGFNQLEMNHCRASMAAQATPRQIVEQVCKSSQIPIKTGEISDKISQQPLPRGKILFGKPQKYLREIAMNNNAFFQLNSKKEVELHAMYDEIPENKVLYYTPESGLVGTPKYTDNGIIIKTLLDPRIKVNSMIKIDNAIIQQQALSINAKALGDKQPQQQKQDQNLVFDKDGEYQVLSVTHSGDTWGDDWSTEVIGISRTGRNTLPTAVQNSSQSMQA